MGMLMVSVISAARAGVSELINKPAAGFLNFIISAGCQRIGEAPTSLSESKVMSLPS